MTSHRANTRRRAASKRARAVFRRVRVLLLGPVRSDDALADVADVVTRETREMER